MIIVWLFQIESSLRVSQTNEKNQQVFKTLVRIFFRLVKGIDYLKLFEIQIYIITGYLETNFFLTITVFIIITQ
jgi:hypothetical protein